MWLKKKRTWPGDQVIKQQRFHSTVLSAGEKKMYSGTYSLYPQGAYKCCETRQTQNNRHKTEDGVQRRYTSSTRNELCWWWKGSINERIQNGLKSKPFGFSYESTSEELLPECLLWEIFQHSSFSPSSP